MPYNPLQKYIHPARILSITQKNMASAIFSATGIDVATKEGLIEEHPLKSLKIDTVAIKTRYDEERAKRNLTGVSQFKHPTGTNSHFRNDVLEPVSDREPITKETSVLICGAGFAGLITAVNLKKDHSVDDFVMIDKAGGFGGTWYWNQYPGTRYVTFVVVHDEPSVYGSLSRVEMMC